MARETRKDLEMMNVDFGGPDGPLNTHFLLSIFDEKKLCPIFYGKNEEKQKVYHALKNDMHAELQTKRLRFIWHEAVILSLTRNFLSSITNNYVFIV